MGKGSVIGDHAQLSHVFACGDEKAGKRDRERAKGGRQQVNHLPNGASTIRDKEARGGLEKRALGKKAPLKVLTKMTGEPKRTKRDGKKS